MDGVLRIASKLLVGVALAAPLIMQAPCARAENDVARGASVFALKCSSCHRAEQGGRALIGPNLFGVVGRKAGSAPGFAYSDAMKNSALIWSQPELAAYLKSPMKVVPGTHMMFIGLRAPGEGEAVAAYLATLK